MEGKARELRDNGKGHRPNPARALTEAEEKILCDCGQFGDKAPQALLSLWYFVTQHFGMRGRQEHHTMKIDDFETNIDDTGVKYFTFAEKRTKTRNTGLKPSVRQSIPKMFATGGEKCIVQIFKTYVSRRPEALRDSGPFYLQPLPIPRGITWFKRVPLGENTIGNMMNKMKQNSPLSELCPSKKLTNHSARKTVVKKLQSNGVQKSEIRTITGHASTEGLDSYDEGDERQQRALSNITDGEESRLEARSKPVLSNTGSTVNFSRIAARVNPYQRTRALQPLHINTNAHCQQVSSQNRGLQNGSALT